MSGREPVRIRSVEAVSFRNHERLVVTPGPGLTVLVGPNAVGKSNLLEAVTLAASAASFRQFSWPDVVKEGQDRALVRVEAERGSVGVAVSLEVESSGKKTFFVDGVRKRTVSDIAGRIPVVTFVPDDLQLAKGPAEARRNALDALGSQLSGAYASLKSEYGRIVRQRTAALKQEGEKKGTPEWDELLVRTGAAFFIHRARLAARIDKEIVDLYRSLAGGERLEVRIEPSWGGEGRAPHEWAGATKEVAEQHMRQALEQISATERARGLTLIGPHRDDFGLLIEGLPARGFASQGQQRSLALAWKMAEAEVVGDVLGYSPVLLLDDVMSELDEHRRAALQEFVASGPQSLITTTNLAYFDEERLKDAEIVRVDDVR